MVLFFRVIIADDDVLLVKFQVVLQVFVSYVAERVVACSQFLDYGSYVDFSQELFFTLLDHF